MRFQNNCLTLQQEGLRKYTKINLQQIHFPGINPVQEEPIYFIKPKTHAKFGEICSSLERTRLAGLSICQIFLTFSVPFLPRSVNFSAFIAKQVVLPVSSKHYTYELYIWHIFLICLTDIYCN